MAEWGATLFTQEVVVKRYFWEPWGDARDAAFRELKKSAAPTDRGNSGAAQAAVRRRGVPTAKCRTTMSGGLGDTSDCRGHPAIEVARRKFRPCASGALAPGIHPQAMRSALMGTVESLMRDQLLAKTSKFLANYSDEDICAIFMRFMDSCFAPQKQTTRVRSA